MAKTNLGCQSYMAPERIANVHHENYTVSADIYSLGVTLWEAGSGHYPFPADKYDSIFAQLSAIIGEDFSDLEGEFSEECRAFVATCVVKDPLMRPTYSDLLKHPFMVKYSQVDVDVKSWVNAAHQIELSKSVPSSSQ
jgi:mitogen-activated protein kinase kinase